MSKADKLAKAIAYLRERDKYVIDKGNTFVPTWERSSNSASFDTEVAKELQRYRMLVKKDL